MKKLSVIQKQTGSEPWSPFILGLIIMLAIGWLALPQILYSLKKQPFSFNHKAHTMIAQFDCEQCHWFREDGSFSGVPSLEECLGCHSWQERANRYSKAETAFLTEFVTEDGELKKSPSWLIYHREPDHVYFPHVAHVEMAKIGCEECHRGFGQNNRPPQYFVNRISFYSKNVNDNLKMDACISCHFKRGKFENNSCLVCHK